MIEQIAHFIDSGKIKLFCVDSVDAESWYNFDIAPPDRNERHEAYERYIVSEVIPFIRSHCQSEDKLVMTNGCSMGAYHAVNFFLKHPDCFAGTIALSGLYRLDRNEFGMTENDIESVYFNSPVHYLSALNDDNYLTAYRARKIIVCVGQGAWDEEALVDTRDLDTIFRQKEIPAWIDYWGHDVNHDWPWWYEQMNHFLSELYG